MACTAASDTVQIYALGPPVWEVEGLTYGFQRRRRGEGDACPHLQWQGECVELRELGRRLTTPDRGSQILTTYQLLNAQGEEVGRIEVG